MERRNQNSDFEAMVESMQESPQEKEKKTLKRPFKSLKSEAEKFKVRLRSDNSFPSHVIAHFKEAYDLYDSKTTLMTIMSFRRLVRHNGPIAITMSNGILLIGHPYDF